MITSGGNRNPAKLDRGAGTAAGRRGISPACPSQPSANATVPSQVLVVLSPATVNSPWMTREVRAALRVQRERGDGYRVIPLLRPGMAVRALGMWFPDEPVAVVVGPDGLAAVMPSCWRRWASGCPPTARNAPPPRPGR